MRPLLLASLALLALPGHADVTYSENIRPLWQQHCSSCHGAASPYWGEWQKHKDDYKTRQIGPRMDSYAELLHFVGWPQTGALMRQLDDGTRNGKGKPGGMYQHLGSSEAERQANLAIFRAWVGEEAWNGKHWQGKKDEAGITKAELERLRLPY